MELFLTQTETQLSGHQVVDDPQFNSSLTQTTNFTINLKGEGAQCHQDCPHCKNPTFLEPHLSFIHLLESLTEVRKILFFTFTASL